MATLESTLASDRQTTRQVVRLLLTLKLASLIVVGALLCVAGVIAGHAVAAMAGESMDAEAILSAPAMAIAANPAWGVLAGIPSIVCGAAGLVFRRGAWIWATVGTLTLVAGVLLLGLVIFGSLATLQDRLLS
ncbi:MAG: hypothetical protein O2927_01655 [Planctomycetota bacterium]|nr:hypothetical protein [Planctomycetota bacterium]